MRVKEAILCTLFSFPMELVLGILAGLFAGAAAGLGYAIRIVLRQTRKVDAERMRVLNKAFVRDGQAKLFPAELIAEGEDVEFETAVPNHPTRPVSPFQRGLQKAREEAKKTRSAAPLPDAIKEKINAKAEEVRQSA